MNNGTFTISREELSKHLSSHHIFLPASISVFINDQLTSPVGYTDEKFDAEDGLVCHVEEEVFDKYCSGELEYRFIYNLSINGEGAREIELTAVNLIFR